MDRILFQKGVSAFDVRNDPEATRLFRAAAELAPDNGSVTYRLLLLLCSLNLPFKPCTMPGLVVHLCVWISLTKPSQPLKPPSGEETELAFLSCLFVLSFWFRKSHNLKFGPALLAGLLRLGPRGLTQGTTLCCSGVLQLLSQVRSQVDNSALQSVCVWQTKNNHEHENTLTHTRTLTNKLHSHTYS